MNILYLDIDGVLNCIGDISDTDNLITPLNFNFTYDNPIEKDLLDLLVPFVKKHNFKVVISSTWRKIMSKEQFETLLGFELHDDWRTPDSSNGFRGDEINSWMNRNDIPEHYVILDDSSDFHDYQHWIRIDETKGITQTDLDNAEFLYL